MKLLLDTQSFIFYVDRPDRIPSVARAAMEDVAQAIEQGLTLVTSDAAIAQYAAPVLWE